MTEDLIKTLLYQSESDTLDFKRDQYPLAGADSEAKSELVKDVVAYANAWKTSDAHILIGVDENPGGKANVVGVTNHLDDAALQQLVNSKTNRPVRFHYSAITVEGNQVGIITIDHKQDRPIFLDKNFGKLRKDVVYVKRSSSTAEADPDEIAEMGEARAEAAIAIPTLTMEFGNLKSRKGLGTSIGRTSVLLVDPPPPPSNPVAEAQAKVLKAMLQNDKIMKSFDSLGDISKMLSPMGRFRPKPEEIRRYHEEVARFSSVALVIRNTGCITATGVRVEISGQKYEGFEVRDAHDAPQQPTGFPHVQLATFRSSIEVAIHDNEWRAVVDVGRLQPKAEHWTDADLYIAATVPVTVQATARVYADNLSQPVELPLEIRLQTEERIYKPSQQEDE